MEPNGRVRKTAIFSNTNSSTVANEFFDFVQDNPTIDIEHITTYSNNYSTYVIVTYFKQKPTQ